MLLIGGLCAAIGAVMLAYARPEPLPPERRARFLLIVALGAAVGLAMAGWLRMPSDVWVERSFARRLARPLPLAFLVLLAVAGALACVPRFRRGAGLDRARPFVWALALALGGVISGVAMQMRDYEITRYRSQEVRLALEEYRAARGAYPERLEQLVPGWLAEVPRARTGWLESPFEYASTPERYRLSFASSSGTWVFDSRRTEWLLARPSETRPPPREPSQLREP